MPAGKFDERLTRRHFQLLKAHRGRVSVNHTQVRALLTTIAAGRSKPPSGQTKTRVNAGFVKAGDQDGEEDDRANKSDPPENPFTDSPLKDLWDQGLEANNRYWLIRQLVRNGERQLPPQ